MTNRKRFVWMGIGLLLSLSNAVSTPENANAYEQQDVAALLTQLTSPKEAERFQAIEAAKIRSGQFKAAEIESALTTIREKNVSALIFVFMETRNDLLYRLGIPAKMTLENAQGSFPNIALFYARVQPAKGINALMRLYDSHGNQKIAICKAIGETGLPEGAAFLLKKAAQAKEQGSRIPMLAGLKSHPLTVDKSKISSLLRSELDREEIILLSQLNTNFNSGEMISLYKGGTRQRAYVLERVFMTPEHHFEALRFIIDDMMEKKHFDRVRELLMSDRIRSSADEQVRKFRDSVLERVSSGTS